MVVGPMVGLKLIALQAGTSGRAFAARFSAATTVVAILWTRRPRGRTQRPPGQEGGPSGERVHRRPSADSLMRSRPIGRAGRRGRHACGLLAAATGKRWSRSAQTGEQFVARLLAA